MALLIYVALERCVIPCSVIRLMLKNAIEMKNHKSVFRIILKDNPWYEQQYDGPHSALHLAHVPPWNNRNELGRTWLPENNHNSAFMRAYLRLELQLGTFWAKIKMPHNVCWAKFLAWIPTVITFFRLPFKTRLLLADNTVAIAKTGHMFPNSAKFGLNSVNELCS